MKINLLISTILVILIQLSCHAEGLNSGIDYSYHISESKTSGPTVAVIACNNNGPAGSLAIHQIEYWQPASGKIICVDMAGEAFSDDRQDNNQNIRQLLNKYSPDYIIELWESYDYKASIPASHGATIKTYYDDHSNELAQDILRYVKAITPQETKEYWHTENTPYIQVHSIASELANSNEIKLIQIVTTAKEKNEELWLRTRQHRYAVYAILVQLNITEPEQSPDKITSKNEDKNIKYIAVYNGPGAVSSSGHSPYWITQSMAHLKGSITMLVGPDEIQAGILQQFDTVLFGGGLAKTQAAGLGENGMNEVRKFVENGGRYVGICAGAFLASSASYGLKILNAEMTSSKEKEIVKLKLTDKGQDILHAPESISCKYSGGPVNIHPANIDTLPDYEVLAYFDSMPDTLSKYNNTPAVIAGRYGKGMAIAFSPHPERFPGPQNALWSSLQP